MNNSNQFNKLDFLAKISKMNKYTEILKYYFRNKKYLGKLEMTFCIEQKPSSINPFSDLSDQANLCIKNVFASHDIKFLNENIIQKHIQGNAARFPIDMIFSFDSNFASYINTYRNNGHIQEKQEKNLLKL